MENKEFDKKVQEMISDLREKYDPSSWDSFEKKLDSEQGMDDLIKSSLESHEEPFNEAHWEMLTAEITRRRNRAIVKRSAEFVIILLLILTTHNFLQIKSDRTRDEIHLEQIGFDYALNNNSKPRIIPSDDHTLTNQSESDLFQNSTAIAQAKSNDLPPLTFIQDQNILLIAENDTYGDNSYFNQQISPDENNLIISASILSASLSDEQEKATKIDFALLGVLDILPLHTPKSGLGYFDDPVIIADDSGDGLWVGITAGSDVNFINSPFDLNLLKNPIRSYSGAITYGVTASKDFGLVELSSGLLFSSKNYFPQRIKEFVPSLNQKYLETSLVSLEYEQYQIPLLVHLHTRRICGWGMFGTFGFGANIITKTLYDVKTKVRSFSSAPASTNSLEIDLLELPRGALQDGGLGSNVYLSGILGFGIEKRFKNRFALTAQTTYQHSLSNEINPVINRTQQLGFTLGAKLNLNK